MSNIIKIKRGAGKPANGVLKAGELGFDTTNKDLYIGTDDTDSSVAEKIGLGSYSTDFAKFPGGYGRGTTASSSGASVIDSPADGVVYKASSDAIGIMKILLPQDFNRSMIKFDVDIFSYDKQLIETISFGGQIYKNANTGAYNWSYRSYDIKGSSVNHAMLNLPINFGRHNSRAAVSIGKIDTEWGYNVVAIKNIIVYYRGYSTDYWSSGWQIIIDANPLNEILNTHENPLSRNRENLGFTYGTTVPTETPATGEGSVYFKISDDETSKYPTLDMIYPVGSLYWSMNSTDPSTLFGGTWERIKDKFVLAAGDSYSVGATGGESTHKLSASEMPSHTHTFTGSAVTSGGGGSHNHGWKGYYTSVGGGVSGVAATFGNTPADSYINSGKGIQSVGNHTHSVTAQGTNSSTGGGSAHNNMPPYLVAYCWQRIS